MIMTSRFRGFRINKDKRPNYDKFEIHFGIDHRYGPYRYTYHRVLINEIKLGSFSRC